MNATHRQNVRSAKSFSVSGSRWLSESEYIGDPSGDCKNRKDRLATAAIERKLRKRALARKRK